MPKPPRATPRSAPWNAARERFGGLGVDVDRALDRLGRVTVSMPCWQGDDVRGFEPGAAPPDGGIAVTGRHPGRARTADELRADLDVALSLIPGRHRVNLHAIYGEFGDRRVGRDEVGAEHFRGWIDWARDRRLGLDFNPTCFAHPLAADGLTLSHPDPAIRRFWIAHCRRSREIGAAMGRATGSACVVNVWIPDGFKDTPADRRAPRERLVRALDAVFATELPERQMLDAVESKLFGIGAESCTVGSHEFHLGYAITRRKLLCLDTGHFHPTESVADKLSAVLPWVPGILLHVSRGVRWDSDHIATGTDELQSLTREAVASGGLARIRFGLDSFDASVNRVAAWVIGARAFLRAMLVAFLEPPAIREAERAGDFTARLALQEEARNLPFGAVWDHHCETAGVPVGGAWLEEVRRHERDVLRRRS